MPASAFPVTRDPSASEQYERLLFSESAEAHGLARVVERAYCRKCGGVRRICTLTRHDIICLDCGSNLAEEEITQ